MLRNLVAYVDFNTITMIACSVARHNLCKICGGSLSHYSHDKIFGGKRVYLVCLAIWIVSLAIIMPDITGTTGVFSWTASAYGCDTVCPVSGCANVGPFISIIGNALFMVLFYSALFRKLLLAGQLLGGSDAHDFIKHQRSITLTMLLLVMAYLAFLLPVVAVGWGLWTPWQATSISNQVKAVLASVYWWMYGVNFIIYLASNNRIRSAYVRFLTDMWAKLSDGSKDAPPGLSTGSLTQMG